MSAWHKQVYGPIILAAISGLFVARASAQPQYEVIDLGSIGGSFVWPGGINDSESIVGYAENSNGREHAFLWKNRVIIDLGTLDTLASSASHATGINNSGEIVGYSSDSLPPRPFFWKDGIMTVLSGLDAPENLAYAVNDSGQIVGEFKTAPNTSHGFLWDKGVTTDLGTLPSSEPGSQARAINNSGAIAGDSYVSHGNHAFLWQHGLMTDLSLPDSLSSQANGINDSGFVVGQYSDSLGAHPSLWKAGIRQNLDTAGTGLVANAINNLNQIVGNAVNFSLPFKWENGVIQMLNDLVDPDSGWVLSAATAINNKGDIVGAGIHHGASRGFLLRAVGTTGVVDRNRGGAPVKFALMQNYPNPFNPATSMSFVVGHTSLVTLTVYDLLGREVTTVAREYLQPGVYVRTWNANGASSGVYFYRLRAGTFEKTEKMILLR